MTATAHSHTHTHTHTHAESSALLASPPCPPSQAPSGYSSISHPQRPPNPSRSFEDNVILETSPLGRTITWSSAYIMTISRVLGSGIYATPGSILQSVGSPGAALLVWLLGALVAACGLVGSLEYGCMLPRSGGAKVFLEFTYRRPRFLASVMVAAHIVLVTFTATNCIIFAQYFVFALGLGRDDVGADRDRWMERVCALGLMTAVTGMHAVVPRAAARIQDVVGFLKLGVLVFMFLSGVYVVLALEPQTGAPSSSAAAASVVVAQAGQLSWDALWKDSIWHWAVLARALFKVSYCYAGLDGLTGVMNEVKDPVRTLRSVAASALLTSFALYTLINIAYFLVVPVEEIKKSGELIAALFFQRVFGPRLGETILPLVVALSAAGNVAVVTFSYARIKQEIARQGLLPFSSILSSTKPFGSPLGGLVVNFIPTFLVILLPPAGEIFSFVLEVESYNTQLLILAMGVGLIWLRHKRPDLKRPFRAWIPAVVIRSILSVALLLAPLFPAKESDSDATYAVVGVGLMVTGLVYWYIWTILLPRVKGYRLEEEEVLLDDGTTMTKLTHKYHRRPSR